MNVTLKPMEIVFYVPTVRTNIKGRDAKIGNAAATAAGHLIQMQVLQIEGACRITVSHQQPRPH